MSYQEELSLLDELSRGRKTNGLNTHAKPYHAEKYQHYQKSQPRAAISSRSTKAMLLTAMRKTQAIFKISSYGKGKERILAHMKYISRRGRLALEDQNGNKLVNTKEHKQLINEWAHDFGDNTRSRDTMHIVLSTPPGTKRESALQAAKQFLETEYKADGHDYIFVAHNDTDHPHIHAVIKMVSHLGKKLNPRKAYLRSVRERYADICREHGIDVEASSRAERGLAGPSPKSVFVQMRRRSVRPEVDIRLMKKIMQERSQSRVAKHPSEEKMLRRNQIIRKRYVEKARLITKKASQLNNKQKKDSYRKASDIMISFANGIPVEASKSLSKISNYEFTNIYSLGYACNLNKSKNCSVNNGKHSTIINEQNQELEV